MLFRLVRPVTRTGSRNHQYVRQIPSDIRSKATGLTLSIPVVRRSGYQDASGSYREDTSLQSRFVIAKKIDVKTVVVKFAESALTLKANTDRWLCNIR